MKKLREKAFTLIEIIAAIIIIGIIALIAVPAVSRYINESKKTAYISYEHSMVDAAKNQVIKCINGEEKQCDIPELNGKDLIYLNELIDRGYLELMSDPNSKGFCDSELSYVEISNTGNDYEYTACLYCGDYQTEKPLCATYTMGLDGDKPVCGKVTGAGTPGTWTNTNRTISVACSDETSGCKRAAFTKTFSTTTATSKITIVDASGEVNECPVDVYVDKTIPTCELSVDTTAMYDSENGFYAVPVNVSLKKIGSTYGSDTDSGLQTYGIGTSITNRDYNKQTVITAQAGITNVIGYVKDNAGNEGTCSQTVRVGSSKPKFDFRYGYQIYPEGEPKTLSGITETGTSLKTTSTNPVMTITNLNKYTNVDKVVITLSSAIPSTTTGSLKYTGSSSGTVTAPFAEGTKTITFNIPSGTYSSFEIKFGALSEKTYNVEKIEVLTTNGGVFTNKDVSINIFPIDTGTQTTGYSFNSGTTYGTETKYTYSSNASGTLYTRNKYNLMSDPVSYQITGIDKKVPTVALTSKKVGTSTVVASDTWSDKKLDFSIAASNVGISGANIYYCIDTNNSCNPTTSITSGVNSTAAGELTGIYYIRYKVTNAAGTQSGVSTYKAKVDVTTPTCTISASKTGWTNQDITLTITGNTTGASTIASYSWDGSTFNSTTTKTVGANGTYTAKVKNGAGTVGTCSYAVSNIDKTPPTCSLKAEGTKKSGTDIYLTNVTISFATTNDEGGSNVASYGLTSTTGDKTATLSTNETKTYTGYVSDGAGSITTCTITVQRNNNLTLTYNNNGGSGCTSKTVTYNSTYGDLCMPTRPGYYFTGWYTAASDGTRKQKDDKYTTTNDSTLYAYWTICPAGNYCEGYNKNVACPEGTFSSGTGNSSCSKCPAGQYNTGTGNTGCSQCPAGSFSSGTGNTTCTKCPAGQFNTGTGNSSCSQCPAGQFNTGTGNTSCSQCPAGSYSVGTGNSECTSCPSGSTCPAGSTAKSECNFNATPSKWTKTTQKCGITDYRYFFNATSFVQDATGVTSCGSSSFTCNASNYNKSYDSCVAKYNTYWGTESTSTVSSCSPNTFNCEPANNGKTNTTCTTNYEYYYVEQSDSEVGACNPSNKTCNSANHGATDIACRSVDYYNFGSTTTSTVSDCANSSFSTCDAAHSGQVSRTCTTNYNYSFGTQTTTTASSCTANTFTCNADNWGKTHTTCTTNYNYAFGAETTTTASSCTASTFTCNADNWAKLYTGCTTNYNYAFGAESSSTESSCSASSITCNASNYNKQNVACSTNYSYAFGAESSSTESSCSASSITCNASNYNKQNVACSTNYSYAFGSATSTTESSCTASSITCNASNYNKQNVACTTNYQYGNAVANSEIATTCSATAAVTCNASNVGKTYVTCTDSSTYSFGSETSTSVTSCSANSITCNASNSGKTNVRCVDASTYSFGSSTSTVSSCTTSSSFTCNASNSGKSYVATCVYNASTKKYTKTTKTCNKTTSYTKYSKTCNKTQKYTKYTYKCDKRGVANYPKTVKTCNRSVSSYTKTVKTCNRSVSSYTKTVKTCNRSVKDYTKVTKTCNRSVKDYTKVTKTCNRSVKDYTKSEKKCLKTTKTFQVERVCSRKVTNYTKKTKVCYSTIASYDVTRYKCSRTASAFAFSATNTPDVTSCTTDSSFTCNADNVNKEYVSGCAITGYSCPSGTTLKNTNKCYYN